MPRSYRHIQYYEKEIIELRSKGKTGREICERLGISKKQYENFITRYNKKQQKLEAGIWGGSPSHRSIHPFLQQWKNLAKNKTDSVRKTKSVCCLNLIFSTKGTFFVLSVQFGAVQIDYDLLVFLF